MSLMNLPMAARPTMGAMLGSRLTPSSAHMSMMAGLSMRRWALMKLWLKLRISALGSAGGAGVCGEENGRKNRNGRARKVERHAACMSVPPERPSYRNCRRNGRGMKAADYIAIGSFAWRETYQQGLCCAWGKIVRV